MQYAHILRRTSLREGVLPRPHADTPLARILAERGMTQLELVTLSGVSRPTVWHAVKGRPSVSAASWLAIAAALGVPVAMINPELGELVDSVAS